MNNNVRLLFLGRYAHYKGISLIPKILNLFIRDALCIDSNAAPIVVVIISPQATLISGSIDKSILQTYKHLIHYELYPSLPESRKFEVIRSCHCLLFPSTTSAEAFGLVQLEAFAVGVPSVCFNLPQSGVAFLNQHRYVGYVANPFSVSDFCEGIKYCLENKSHLQANMISHLKVFTRQQMLNRVSRVLFS